MSNVSNNQLLPAIQTLHIADMYEDVQVHQLLVVVSELVSTLSESNQQRLVTTTLLREANRQ